MRVAGDILEYDDFFRPDNALAYDEKAFSKRHRQSRQGALELLHDFREQLQTVTDFAPANLEHVLKSWVASRQIEIGSDYSRLAGCRDR